MGKAMSRLGAQEQIRMVRDLIPGSTVTLALGPEGEGVLPWIASITRGDGERCDQACTMAATMPEAIAALRERVEGGLPKAHSPVPEDF
jgi:hypothetical protein